MKDKTEKTTEAADEIAKLVEEISTSGDHDLAHAVETVGAELLAAKRLAAIVFDTEAATDKDFVLAVHDMLCAGNDEDD